MWAAVLTAVKYIGLNLCLVVMLNVDKEEDDADAKTYIW